MYFLLFIFFCFVICPDLIPFFTDRFCFLFKMNHKIFDRNCFLSLWIKFHCWKRIKNTSAANKRILIVQTIPLFPKNPESFLKSCKLYTIFFRISLYCSFFCSKAARDIFSENSFLVSNRKSFTDCNCTSSSNSSISFLKPKSVSSC